MSIYETDQKVTCALRFLAVAAAVELTQDLTMLKLRSTACSNGDLAVVELWID